MSDSATVKRGFFCEKCGFVDADTIDRRSNIHLERWGGCGGQVRVMTMDTTQTSGVRAKTLDDFREDAERQAKRTDEYQSENSKLHNRLEEANIRIEELERRNAELEQLLADATVTKEAKKK